MRLSVIVVTWNSRDDLAACLASLAGQSHQDLDVIVVDNGSADGSAAMAAADFPWCRVLVQPANLGFAEGCNRAIDASTGPWVAVLNNDAVAEPGWARALADAAAAAPPQCGMLQPLLVCDRPAGTINSSGIELTSSGGGRDRDGGRPRAGADPPRDVFCPTGGAAVYRRDMLERVRISGGYFDREHFMYFEDLDLGWRARLAGWTAVYVPAAVATHKGLASSRRHGRAWMVIVSRTNRLRTLLKNGSPWFIARTLPWTLLEIGEVIRYGRLAGAIALARAIGDSLRKRREVNRMMRVTRRSVERRWAGRR